MMEWPKNLFERVSDWCKTTISSDRSWRGTSIWFGLVGFGLTFSGVAFLAEVSNVQNMQFAGAARLSTYLFHAGGFLCVVGPMLMIVSLVGIISTQLDKQKVNVVAWRGYADQAILMQLPAHVDPLIIEYVRGIHRIETLRINDEPVGVLISDAEFLRDHHQGEYLESIRIKPRWDDMLELPFQHTNPDWMNHVGDDTDKVLGVPIRWAINDLIFNLRKAKEVGYNLEDASDYSDFNLTGLLNKSNNTYKIGLWNWFLPTLQFLLLCEDRNLDVRKVHECKVRGDLNEVSLEQIARIIKQNAERFTVLDSPMELRDSLIAKGGCWFVYGAGSWALSLLQFDHIDIRKLVPSRGVTAWVECLTFPSRGLNERALRRKFVDAFLAPKMQMALSESKEYLSAPVTDNAIAQLTGLVKKKDPTQGEQRLIAYIKYLIHHKFINQGNIMAEKLIPRKLPKDWTAWDSIWKDIISTVRQAQRR